MNQNKYKILFASSEVFPFVKTGGLADVSQALPQTLHTLKHDIKIVLPAYRSLQNQLQQSTFIASSVFPEGEINIYETNLPNSGVKVWLIDCPELFNRAGGPYSDENDQPWEDNIIRFALFSRTIAELSIDNLGLNWKPDILHCNDWQTALAPALLKNEVLRPGIVFTIHNLAYQGVFPLSLALELHLDDELYSYESMEFYNQFSFLKGGILYSDQVTTVSPTYANEIQTEKHGAGLDAFLRSQSHKLSGIINGININEWNPSADKLIYANYDSISLELKQKNKQQLQEELKLVIDSNVPLIATVSRLVLQKGIDLIIEVLPEFLGSSIQFVILGKGDEKIESELVNFARNNPNRVYLRLGYDESLAHKITASADFFLMPSRFEPCGLNQMYSQYYGTIPIVHKTGGLADTVVDDALHSDSSTGIVFEHDEPESLSNAIGRALDVYENEKLFRKMQLNAMKQDFSWNRSAMKYLQVYKKAVNASV